MDSLVLLSTHLIDHDTKHEIIIDFSIYKESCGSPLLSHSLHIILVSLLDAWLINFGMVILCTTLIES